MNSHGKSSTNPQRPPPVSQPLSHGYRPNSAQKPPRSGQQHPQEKLYSNSPKAKRGAQNNAENAQTSTGQKGGKTSQPQELLVMTIDLGDGSKDLLKVFEGEDPYDLAQEFCERHGLNPQLVEPLAQNIYGNMEQVLKESVETLDMCSTSQYNGTVSEPRGSDSKQDTGKFREVGDAPRSSQKNSNYEEQGNAQDLYRGVTSQEEDHDEHHEQLQEEEEGIEPEEYEEQHEEGQQRYEEGQEEQYYNEEGGDIEGNGPPAKYEDVADMYEMIDTEGNSAGLVDRAGHGNAQSFEGHLGHAMSEKDLRGSRGPQEVNYGGYNGKGALQAQIERKVNSAMVSGSSDMEKRRLNPDFPVGEKMTKSWMPQPGDFQSEEEYLDYLIASQYGSGREKLTPTGRYEPSHVPMINQSSKQMLSQKPQEKLSVYDRLHNQGKLKNMKKNALSNQNVHASQQNTSQMNQSMKRNSSSILHSQASQMNDINYGTLLYHRGVKKNEELQKHLIERRKEKMEISTKECTFSPGLNIISRQIMSTKGRMESLPDKLIQTGEDLKDRLERARHIKQVQELDECTFKPEINIISQKIDNEKARMGYNGEYDRCMKLYEESKIRTEIQKSQSRILAPECTFKPQTNNYMGSPLANTTFEQRSKKFEDRLERINYVRQMKQENEIFDPQTGEPLFQPKVGRAPKVGRNNGGLPIGDYLYNQQYKIAASKKKLQENHERSVQANMARSGDNSHAMVENMMRRRLEDIFRRLDNDGDGLISSAKIDISSVGTDVLETLAPLLCEMEERNQTLDFEGFCEQTEKLLRTLTIAERDALILGRKVTIEEPQFTFKPEIDKRSERLAQKKRPQGDFNSLYDTYVDQQRLKEEKIREKQEMKTEAELRECSFRPRLFTSPKALNSTTNNSNYFTDPLFF